MSFGKQPFFKVAARRLVGTVGVVLGLWRTSPQTIMLPRNNASLTLLVFALFRRKVVLFSDGLSDVANLHVNPLWKRVLGELPGVDITYDIFVPPLSPVRTLTYVTPLLKIGPKGKRTDRPVALFIAKAPHGLPQARALALAVKAIERFNGAGIKVLIKDHPSNRLLASDQMESCFSLIEGLELATPRESVGELLSSWNVSVVFGFPSTALLDALSTGAIQHISVIEVSSSISDDALRERYKSYERFLRRFAGASVL